MPPENEKFQAIKEAATTGALLVSNIGMLIAVTALAYLAVF